MTSEIIAQCSQGYSQQRGREDLTPVPSVEPLAHSQLWTSFPHLFLQRMVHGSLSILPQQSCGLSQCMCQTEAAGDGGSRAALTQALSCWVPERWRSGWIKGVCSQWWNRRSSVGTSHSPTKSMTCRKPNVFFTQLLHLAELSLILGMMPGGFFFSLAPSKSVPQGHLRSLRPGLWKLPCCS